MKAHTTSDTFIKERNKNGLGLFLFLLSLLSFGSLTQAHAQATTLKDSNGKITIHSHLVFLEFGDTGLSLDDLEHEASFITNQIRNEWAPALQKNNADLVLTHQLIKSVTQPVITPSDPKDNFVILTRDSQIPRSLVLGATPGGNIAIFKIKSDPILPKTYAHEFGHILGLSHPSQSDSKAQIMPIMKPLSFEEPFVERQTTSQEVQTVLESISWSENQGHIGYKNLDISEISPREYPRYFRLIQNLIQNQSAR